MEDADVTIVAGCGIHNGGDAKSQHDGIHAFYVGKNAKVKYIEKHYGTGDGLGERVLNPQTIIELSEGSYQSPGSHLHCPHPLKWHRTRYVPCTCYSRLFSTEKPGLNALLQPSGKSGSPYNPPR